MYLLHCLLMIGVFLELIFSKTVDFVELGLWFGVLGIRESLEIKYEKFVYTSWFCL